MASIGTHNAYAESADKNEKLLVKCKVNVDLSGSFTTTLDYEDVQKIKGYGIKQLQRNRMGREGFFSSKSLDGLISKIEGVLEECISRELTEEKVVIRYSLATSSSFGKTTDGIVVPNLGWTRAGSVENRWIDGTINVNSSNRAAVGVQVFAEVVLRQVYKYKSGREAVEYKGYLPNEHDQHDYYMDWLVSQTAHSRPNGAPLREIEYTEERAKFFVDMISTLCLISEKVTQFESPEAMLSLIDNGGRLLNG